MTKVFNKSSEKEKRRNLRKNLSPIETKLWHRFKGRQIGGYKFRRQYSIGRYVDDFYCPKVKLALELDGRTHDENDEVRIYDKKRQEYIESFGVKFLRFSNWEIIENIEGVLDRVLSVCEELEDSKGK